MTQLESFTHAVLGKTGIRVHRLGFAATYRPGKETIYGALDHGLNYFFFFPIDTQMVAVLRDVLRRDREKYVVATGPGNFLLWRQNPIRALERRLKQLRTDYIDVFLFLGVLKDKDFPQFYREQFYRLREAGKVRSIGISTHNRAFAGKLAKEGAVDVLMIRYNAAHRGAEMEIFPFLQPHNPGVVSYTATRWTYLLRRPKGWPRDGFVPTAGMCYRFVLSNPHVHLCMTAPRSKKQLEENVAALKEGPLRDEEMKMMRKFGDAVHDSRKWFM